MTPLSLVHGGEVSTMLVDMLPHEPDDIDTDADEFTQRAEARQLARAGIHQRRKHDTGRHNVHHRPVTYAPGDRVCAWMPIRKRGLSQKLPMSDPIKCCDG